MRMRDAESEVIFGTTEVSLGAYDLVNQLLPCIRLSFDMDVGRCVSIHLAVVVENLPEGTII